jgi:hypothetical protein
MKPIWFFTYHEHIADEASIGLTLMEACETQVDLVLEMLALVENALEMGWAGI